MQKDKPSENSIKINIFRNYICNVMQIVFLELSLTEHLEMLLILWLAAFHDANETLFLLIANFYMFML